jgi:hypothetical protein
MTEKYIPKVGEKCLYQDNVGLTETTILAIHPDGGSAWHEAVFSFEDKTSFSTDNFSQFRPLKTKADAERTAVIHTLSKVLIKTSSNWGHDSPTTIARKVVDAGYQKVGDEISSELFTDAYLDRPSYQDLQMFATRFKIYLRGE